MSDVSPSIRCKHCGSVFQPDVKAKSAWYCPGCQGKNPNLKRQYRSVADLCILGLVVTILRTCLSLREHGVEIDIILDVNFALSMLHAGLLLVIIVLFYKSKTPWTNTTGKTLFWIALGLAFLSNAVIPLISGNLLGIGPAIVYVAVFSFLFWLDSQARQCTAPPPMAIPLKKEQ